MYGDVIISPIYHENIVHVTNAIPVTDGDNFVIAVSFEEHDSITNNTLNKCKRCFVCLFCTSFLCFIFFLIMGGFEYFLNVDD